MHATISEIERFHGLFNSALGQSVHGSTMINQQPQFRETIAWKGKGFRGTVEFLLWPEGQHQRVTMSDTGRPVLQLRDVGGDDTGGWISWHESWVKEKQKDEGFELKEVGLSFFWGPRTRLDQVFRAEWSGSVIERAAHPHWHADCAVIGSEIGISRIHFGMGGWRQAGQNSACWQVRPTEADDIRAWATKTVEYCREQLIHYPPN